MATHNLMFFLQNTPFSVVGTSTVHNSLLVSNLNTMNTIVIFILFLIKEGGKLSFALLFPSSWC